MSSDKSSEMQVSAESTDANSADASDINMLASDSEDTTSIANSSGAGGSALEPEATPPSVSSTASSTVSSTASSTTAAAPEPPAAATSPSIAERISVPAQAPSDGDDEGGEWDMLSSRIKAFFEANNLLDHWQNLRQPLLLIGALIALILTVRIYGGILDAIATVPLAPRLFQLVGTIYAAWFAATRLVLSSERKKISGNVKDVWSSIRGGGQR